MFIMFYIIILVYSDFFFLLLFSRVAVLFSTGCSRAGIPPLSLRSLLGEFAFIFHIRFSGQALAYFLSAVSAGQCVVFQGAAVEGIGIPLSELVSHWREVSFPWEICLERSWAHFRSMVSEHTFANIPSIVPARECVIFRGSFNGWSSGSIAVFPCDWEVHPFMGGIP